MTITTMVFRRLNHQRTDGLTVNKAFSVDRSVLPMCVDPGSGAGSSA